MSNLSDLVQGITKGNKTGIEMAGAVVRTLSDVVGYVKVGVDVVNFLLSKDDELQQVLASIQEDFHQLTSFIAAEDKLARISNIVNAIYPALTVFQLLPATLHSPPSPAEISGTIETCAKAAVFFADFDISWQAAWQATPYYSDEWSGQLAPDVPGDNLVFNYTYTLPQFLRAIYILLTTIGALDPTSLSYYQPTLRSCLTRLSAVHDTIVSSGIVGTRVPKTSEVGIVGHVPETGFPTVWLTDWFDRRNQLMWPHGDVERYSGASSVASYFFYEIDMDRLDRDTQNNFVRLIQLRIAQQKKALYSQLGLPEARQVINQLRSMTGQPPLADAPYENWSIKEALGIMGLPLAASARSLLSVVKATPPFGGGWEYTPHPDPFSYTWRPGRPLPAGLRGLLAGY